MGSSGESQLTPEELHLRAVAAAHSSWAKTEDRAQRTANGRKAFEQRFYVGIPDDLPPKERDKVYAVIRSDIGLMVDPSFFFGSDSLAVRCIIRCGFGYPHHAAVCRISLGGGS